MGSSDVSWTRRERDGREGSIRLSGKDGDKTNGDNGDCWYVDAGKDKAALV